MTCQECLCRDADGGRKAGSAALRKRVGPTSRAGFEKVSVSTYLHSARTHSPNSSTHPSPVVLLPVERVLLPPVLPVLIPIIVMALRMLLLCILHLMIRVVWLVPLLP